MTGAPYDYFSTQTENTSRRLPAQPPSGPARIREILRRNQDLLRNAGSLAATTGVTSLAGFGYWIYAARVFPQQAVGYGSAAISMIALLSIIGVFGHGTMLIGELPRRESRGGLVMAAIIASFTASLILGLGFSLVSLAFGNRFVEIAGTFGRVTIFSFGVATTAAAYVFDDATIGLMRGGLQLTRNMVFSIAKILALPATGLVLHDLFGVGIMVSWVLGALVSLLPVIVLIKRDGGSVLYRPDWNSLWQLRKVTLAHNWLNLAIAAPGKLTPVLVVLVVSPSSNAAFYIAAMLVSFLTMVPTHLSTVLFAIASAAPEAISEKLRFVLRMSLFIGVPGGLILGMTSHIVLSVFGASYASLATVPLWLLIATYLPGVPNTVYIAVCRASGRVNQAAIFLSVAAVIQMAAILVGGKLGGLDGLSCGMLAVAVLQALVTAPSVLRTAYGSAQVPSSTAPTAESQPRKHVHAPTDAIRLRQEAGLAALVAIATTVAADRNRPSGMTGGGPVLKPTASMALTRPQMSVGRKTGRHRYSLIAATVANPVLADGITEANSHDRQEAGLAALIAIATHAARF